MVVQVYEATSIKGAQELAGVGVDHIGVVVGKGPFGTEVTMDKTKEIFASLPKRVKGVVLPLSYNLSKIVEIVRRTQPDICHLCALPEKISPQDVIFIKKEIPNVKIMRTIPVVNEKSIDLAKQYDGIADYLLLDSKGKDGWQAGVTGKPHNWEISRRIVETVRVPVILAGGLGPDNVEEAIKIVKPYGVDSKTKTDKLEEKGKDLSKVRDFVKKAKIGGGENG